VRRPAAILFVAAGLLVSLAALPGPGVLPMATATHQGDIGCPSDPVPQHDGIIEPGEYSENFFDPRTKALVYFTCPEDGEGMMHVGLVTSWEEWTELRFQATEPWNGDYNVVRLRLEASALETLDGFSQGTAPGFVDDLSLGGSFDVIDPVGVRRIDDRVFEFAFPLASGDVYDSQLAANGSYHFQLALASEQTLPLESNDQLIELGEDLVSGLWTAVGLTLPPGNVPVESSEIIVGLRDASFSPLAFRSVTVFARTTFGYLDLGRVVTSEQGLGSVEYAPRGEGEYLIGAAFAGEGGHLASVTWLTLVVTAPTVAPSTLGDLLVVEALIFVVVIGVWATYAYALFLVGRTMLGGRKKKGKAASGGGDQSA
jgi:hypothetical protein